MKIHKLIVKNKDTNYPILIGKGALNLLAKQVKILSPDVKKVAIIFDKNVPNFLKERLKNF